ncbi:MAG: ABC transporter substrate-binding protein [Breznakibacter sp.]
MLTGEETLKYIADNHPQLLGEFAGLGLGGYFLPDTLSVAGRFTRLSSVCASNHIDVPQLVARLNSLLEQERGAKNNLSATLGHMHLTAMLPCGLRNPYKEKLEEHLQANADLYKGLNYMAEGNLNHEQSYYPLLDQIDNPDNLPDIMIASDINNCFHTHFVSRFVNKGVFAEYMPFEPNKYLSDAGFNDPLKRYTMLTANLLVVVVDREKLGDRPMPRTWADILSPIFVNDIVMRGEDNFFCNAVMLPLYKDFGMEAIKAMAGNVKSGRHPAEMVKLAGAEKPEAATIYIMPYFFAKKIQSGRVDIVWPADGAIASPVFLLVKADRIERHKPLLDYLLSTDMAQMLVKRHFPSINPQVGNDTLPGSVKWLGWDFLAKNDIAVLKEQIRTRFMEVWMKGRIETKPVAP